MRVAASFAVPAVMFMAATLFVAVRVPAVAMAVLPLSFAVMMAVPFRLGGSGQLEVLAVCQHGAAVAMACLALVGMPMPAAAVPVLFSIMVMALSFCVRAAAFAVCVFAIVRMAMPVSVALLIVAMARFAMAVPVRVVAMTVLFPIAAVAMPVGQVVAVLLLPADAHVHMRPPNAALLRRNCRDLQAGNAQRVHVPQKLLPGPRLQQLVKRGHEHIARRAHIAL